MRVIIAPSKLHIQPILLSGSVVHYIPKDKNLEVIIKLQSITLYSPVGKDAKLATCTEQTTICGHKNCSSCTTSSDGSSPSGQSESQARLTQARRLGKDP